jgi:glyoxylase-like metal-dependent hydrolase (beta-lactamase superfamily II)
MEKVAPGVYQVSRGVNAFIVDGDEGVVLIDTGLPRRHGAIVDGLGEVGRSVADVGAILITHAHVDHVGGLAAIRSPTTASVYASHEDARVVRGERRPSPPPMFDRLGILKPVVARLIPAPTPSSVDVEIGLGDEAILPADFTMIATPGHTSGHLSYLLDRAGGVLFVGDAAVHKRGAVVRGFFNKSDPVIDASIRRLAERRFDVACFGHSGSIAEDASALFAAF